MPIGNTRAANLAGFFVFCCGLAFIVTATLLNLVHAQLVDGQGSVSRFVKMMYTTFGTLGITITLVGLGLALIYLSGVFRVSRRESDSSAQTTPRPLNGMPLFYVPSDDPPPSGPLPNGTMVLRTRKYLQNH